MGDTVAGDGRGQTVPRPGNRHGRHPGTAGSWRRTAARTRLGPVLSDNGSDLARVFDENRDKEVTD